VRLARKLIVAILLGLVLVLSVLGYLRVRRELDVFDADMRRDHAVVARSLNTAVLMAWSAGRRGDAMRAIAEAASDDRVRVRWLDPAAPEEPSSRNWRVSRFPVTMEGQTIGTLEVSEARSEERAYVRATVVQTVAATVALSLIASGIVVGLTLYFVGRPVRLLRDKMRRIGGGDLTGPLALRQRDEMGELSRDIDVMCDRLWEARLQIERETDGRLQAIEQLRHADRLATVGTLASGIAHELGTPLSVVLARARMLEDAQSTMEETVESARIIAGQVERMSAIIRQLLDFARRRSRGEDLGTLEREPVSLGELVTRTLSLVTPLAQRRQVQLAFTCAEDLVVTVDQGGVQQVVLNLVMNALQAMGHPGGVQLTLAREQAHAPASVDGAALEYARLTVQDEGVGIDPEILPRVFEPFFTTKKVGEGTGLGLSVSYGIIREHGGWIDVQSRPGSGSRFSVYLPMPAAAAAGLAS
jgi:two-component system NtrC family sensor kinase